MKIAIASGKGGTGKTLVSVNLAVTNSKETLLLDCDVEEPNDRVFFDELSQSHTRRVSIKIPRIDNSVCISCKACVNACQFNALAMLADRVMIFDELCHACGACAYVCPPGAISWIDKPIISEVDKTEIADVAIGCKIIKGAQTKVTFVKVLNYIETELHMIVQTGRCTIDGVKYTYKKIIANKRKE